jgi:transposase
MTPLFLNKNYPLCGAKFKKEWFSLVMAGPRKGWKKRKDNAAIRAAGGLVVKKRPPPVCPTKGRFDATAKSAAAAGLPKGQLPHQLRAKLTLQVAKQRHRRTGVRLFQSLDWIQRQVNRIAPLTMRTNRMTTRRDLERHGWSNRSRPTVTPLDHLDIAKRAKWAQHMLDSHNDPWFNSVMFSDEKYFDCIDHSCATMWCEPNEDPTPIEKTNRGPKVHVWGGIWVAADGQVGRQLIVFPEKCSGDNRGVNSKDYINKVLKKLNATMVQQKVFMQDNAPVHKSDETMEFMKTWNFNLMENWPPKSPDLNPIENLWAILAGKVSTRGPKDRKQLETFIKAEWNKLPQDMINKLVKSFRSRLIKCVEHEGEYTQIHRRRYTNE